MNYAIQSTSKRLEELVLSPNPRKLSLLRMAFLFLITYICAGTEDRGAALFVCSAAGLGEKKGSRVDI